MHDPNATSQEKFEPSLRGNLVFKPTTDWFVSYNPQTGSDPMMAKLSKVRAMMTGYMPSDGEETAIKYQGQWFILSGDYREQVLTSYKEIGVRGILQIFYENKSWEHAWSTGTEQELIAAIKSQV